MTPIIQVEFNTGNTIKIENIFETINQSYFLGDLLPGVSTLQVPTGNAFTTNAPYIVIGNFLSKTAELRQFNTISATTLGITSPTAYAHAQGETVSNVPFNQVVIESSPTQNGTYTTLVQIPIDWTSPYTVHQHMAGLPTTWYRARFISVASTTYSNYSAVVSSSSLNDETAGYLIQRARSQMGDTTGITDDYLLNSINDGRDLVNSTYGFGRLNEWRQNFNIPFKILAGTNFINLPSDIDFTETNRTLINVRYARDSIGVTLPVKYVDKRQWNNLSYTNRYSTTVGVTNIAATSIVLDNTGDFPASGSIFVAADAFNQDILVVNYTSNNVVTNTLSGVTGVTRSIPAGTQVWGYSTFTLPSFFTVFDNKIVFERPFPNTMKGKNVYIDYYKKLVPVTATTDTLPEHYRSIYIQYLKFAIKKRRDSTLGADDEDYKSFLAAIKGILGNPYIGQNQIVIT